MRQKLPRQLGLGFNNQQCWLVVLVNMHCMSIQPPKKSEMSFSLWGKWNKSLFYCLFISLALLQWNCKSSHSCSTPPISTMQSSTVGPVFSLPLFQGWEFAHLLICSFSSNQMSNCERFAQIAQDKWVTVSESLRSLISNEWQWANRTGCSWQMSKWVIRGTFFG